MSRLMEFEKFFNDIWGSEDRCLKNISINSDDIRLSAEFFNNSNGLGYGKFDMYFEDFKILDSIHESNYFFMYFNTGSSIMRMKKDANEFYFNPNDVWVGAINEPFGGQNIFQAKKHVKTQCILINKQRIKDFPMFDELANKQDFYIRVGSTNLTQKIILKELENSHLYEGKMREIFIESKILEMVYKSLYDYNFSKEYCDIKLCEYDIKSIKKAREIMLKNMSNPPSIKKLARICAINEFKLKKGFKHIYKTTIYKMLQEERLKNAKELLTNQDVNVTEAARIAGYKSLSHFSKIFKERFDVLPIELIKEKKYYI
ncbi:transcriptional regulator, AraC family [Campylobacter blaseri]|uniref:AraC family transcriptional regulator n=1 Tax=Campylobacter blaseri TaxID=2042961 RepID=A0A2P8R3T0_9BACT|nr:AraC family transcriptional regulator [Campylobacter blaseri]PSM53135.1 AraC family transcriptional regulator [Campylobacter blaseri]PSM54601.1 AraC family transcriptional regulator [Campylobacter blaseri]QKF86926.1 transcriptional regulator, AraC family [Campylobacter blaseri]